MLVCHLDLPLHLPFFSKLWITILTGIPHVILITGATEEEHLHNLDEVLRGLQQHGITVK